MPCPCCFGSIRLPDLGPVRPGDWYCERCELLLAAELLEDDVTGYENGVNCPIHGEARPALDLA